MYSLRRQRHAYIWQFSVSRCKQRYTVVIFTIFFYFSLNRHGRIWRFVLNPPVECESMGDCTPDQLLAFYDAMYVLTKGLQHPNNATDIQLRSGQIAVFHNTRVLHGRTAFETVAGEPMMRWLQGMYFSWDVVFSKLRVLQGRLGLKSPYIPDHSDECF